MPLYLFTGDPYRMQASVQQLACRVDPLWSAFNYQETSDVAAALAQARTMPFGTGDRVTVCRTTLFNKKDEATLALVQRDADALPDCSYLVFIAEKADARLKATKWLKTNGTGTIKDFPVIDVWDMKGTQQLVTEIADRLKLRLSPAVTEALAEAIGPDGYRIESELTKLAIRTPITLEAVLATIENKTQNALDLAEALVAGDKPRALSLLVALKQVPDLHPLQVLSTLIGRFEKLFIVGNSTGTNEEIAKLAGVPNPKQIFYLNRDAQTMGDRLVKILPLLLSAEVAIKSGSDADFELERLVILC